MKTLEEVNKHLLKVGYTVKTIDRIVSFLIGAGLLEAKDYEIECIEGEKDFKDFLDWYNEEKDLNKESINEDLNKAIEELNNNAKQFEEYLKSFEEGHPYKELGKSILELSNQILSDIEKQDKDESYATLNDLEIEAHNALDNIFSTLHEGKLEKDEHDALIDSVNALVILGNEYE